MSAPEPVRLGLEDRGVRYSPGSRLPRILGADEMRSDGHCSRLTMTGPTRQTARDGAPDESCWGSRLQIPNVPLFPLIRSRTVVLTEQFDLTTAFPNTKTRRARTFGIADRITTSDDRPRPGSERVKRDADSPDVARVDKKDRVGRLDDH